MGNTTDSNSEQLKRIKPGVHIIQSPKSNKYYQCPQHAKSTFNKIKISPQYHKLIIHGYIRQNCLLSSNTIMPNDVLMCCKDMCYGNNNYTFRLKDDELNKFMNLKKMKNSSITIKMDKNGNQIKKVKDSNNYNMNSLYHSKKISFNVFNIPFDFQLKSDGMNWITLTFEGLSYSVLNKLRINYVAQISMYCRETKDLVRFWNCIWGVNGKLQIALNKCVTFGSLNFFIKINILEMHRRISAESCMVSYCDRIKIDKYIVHKYILSDKISCLSLMSKQIGNKYYLESFGIDDNWGISIVNKSDVILIYLDLIKIPFDLTIGLLFKCKMILNDINCVSKEKKSFFAVNSNISRCYQKGKVNHFLVFNKKEFNYNIDLSQLTIIVEINVFEVYRINERISQNQWQKYGIN